MAEANWLAASAAVWEARMGAGSFPWGAAGRVLKPLAAHHAPDVIAAHLAEFLDATDPKYIGPGSFARFAMTFATWAPRPLTDEFGMLVDRGSGKHGAR